MIIVLKYLIEYCNKITCKFVNMQLYIYTQLHVCNTSKNTIKNFDIAGVLLISPITLGVAEQILSIKTFSTDVLLPRQQLILQRSPIQNYQLETFAF